MGRSDPDRTEAPRRFVTARLTGERFTMDHVNALAVVDTNADVQTWLFGKTYTARETRARAKRRVAYWNAQGAGDYVVHTHGGAFVGFAGFFPAFRPNALAIGYALMPEWWGAGYGTELALELTRIGLTLGRDELVATVLERNAASRNVLRKAGFVPIGPSPDDAGTLHYRYAADREPE
jgi:RimJ/RimL family protein N-acetyltransferase